MKVSNYLLIIVIIILGVTLVAQNRVIVDLRNEYETGLGGGDILKVQTIDSLQKRCDSLYDELFPTQIELGRHQVAYEIFLERNPKAAEQYDLILSTETE